ncbi:MAG TPA: alpha/beta hydrolase domain-containing protein [Burkholderiales bacterium]|nr:alpha/beta hydrolase domain-containing protein [Burkholderiales bacterium]
MRRVETTIARALAASLVALALPAHARLVRIEIERVESPAFGGASFGTAGRYEKLVGRAYGELDPRDELNRGIVYIDKAPLNAAGRVEYSMDVLIIKPVTMSRGNRTVFYDVVNRGDTRALAVFNVGAAPVSEPKTESDLGDAFLLKRGYTLVASGWQGDVLGTSRLKAQVPVATDPGGKPITKLITAEFIFTKPAYTVSVGYDNGGNLRPYPAVPERVSEARLLRRAGPLAPRETIPASEWSFGACADGRNATPSNTDICYPAGFSTNYAYELVYVAQDPLVMGIGFAATRDLISFLRRNRSITNPLVARGGTFSSSDPMRLAIGFGRSQSGRYIKDFVYQGFNLDESGRPVFDAILPLISGSRLTNTNAEFAMPGRFSTPTEGHFYPGDQFPHSYATVTDPVSNRADGWLMRCTKQKACPKVMHWDSGIEAWAARNSLVATDGLGRSEVPVPENVRLYYFSSAQHVPAAKPDYGICKNLSNPNPYRETVRALLVAMQAWIEQGTPPPASRFPRLSDGMLVPPLPAAAFGFPRIPGLNYTGRHNELYVRDFSAQPPQDIHSKQYVVLVPKVDADGNDVAGVRSMTVQVPLGTYTGWNQRKADFMENEFCYLQGSYFPFAKTASERGGDPRLSLQERYESKAGYLAKVEAAAQQLVSERFLLPEDAARLVEEARSRDLGF